MRKFKKSGPKNQRKPTIGKKVSFLAKKATDYFRQATSHVKSKIEFKREFGLGAFSGIGFENTVSLVRKLWGKKAKIIELPLSKGKGFVVLSREKHVKKVTTEKGVEVSQYFATRIELLKTFGDSGAKGLIDAFRIIDIEARESGSEMIIASTWIFASNPRLLEKFGYIPLDNSAHLHAMEAMRKKKGAKLTLKQKVTVPYEGEIGTEFFPEYYKIVERPTMSGSSGKKIKPKPKNPKK